MTGTGAINLDGSPFAPAQAARSAPFLSHMMALDLEHRRACPAYDRIVRIAFPAAQSIGAIEDLPFLPIDLFKRRALRSGSVAGAVRIESSGTTGAKSQIQMDAADARLSAKCLGAILRNVWGQDRKPLLICDAPHSLQKADAMGARAAAIMGLMPWGRDIAFALHDDLTLNRQAVDGFLGRFGDQPFYAYGFTYLVWQAFAGLTRADGIDLSQAHLLHSGGWKKLAHLGIDPAQFRATLNRATGLERINNFYGMAEMPGVVLMEHEDGFLYVPSFADVIVRDPVTLAPLPMGQTGLIQMINAIPHSYPGHSLLTEDMGAIESIDSGIGGWMGKAVRITGRAPKAALRGCSDVLAGVRI